MSPSRLVCPCCCSAFGIHYRCETVISFTLLQHIVLVQGILLAVSLGLFFAHGLWLAWYERRYQLLLERAQATIGTVVLGVRRCHLQSTSGCALCPCGCRSDCLRILPQVSVGR